jgi:hypothetical protein
MKMVTSHQSVGEKEEKVEPARAMSIPKRMEWLYLEAKFGSDCDYVLDLTGIP